MDRTVDISDFSKTLSFDKRRLRRFIGLLDRDLPDEFKAPKGTMSLAIFNDKDQISRITYS